MRGKRSEGNLRKVDNKTNKTDCFAWEVSWIRLFLARNYCYGSAKVQNRFEKYLWRFCNSDILQAQISNILPIILLTQAISTE